MLVVDDEQTIAEVVARYLERAGYETRQAFADPDAVAAVEAWDPDWLCWTSCFPASTGSR